MNGSIFWRVFWKEYRTQRSFWLAVAVGTVLLQLMVLIVAVNLDNASSVTNVLFAMAVLMPTFYALGCGAIMYAMETEEGTYDLIRMLPASALRVFGGKLAFGLMSCLLLPLPLLVSAWLLARFDLPDVSTLEILRWTTWLFGFLAWGLFFSILTSHVLHAVCFAACINSLFIVWMIGDRIPPQQTAWAFVPITLLFALDAWLANRWMHGERFNFPTLGWAQSETFAGLNQWISRRDFASPSARLLRRLVWEEARNARHLLLVYLPAAALSLLVSDFVWQRFSVPLRELIVVFTPVFLGTFVFHGSHAGHIFRFYAERGVAPGMVWLGKHLVWIPATALMLVALFAIDHVVSQYLSSAPNVGTFLSQLARTFDPYAAMRPSVVIPTIVLVALSLYGAGQFASLFVRSPVTATVLAIVMGLPVYGWHLLLFAGQVSPILAAMLPVALFVATYLRTPNWMLERSTWLDWLNLTAVTGLLIALAILGFAGYRVYEISSSGPGSAALPT